MKIENLMISECVSSENLMNLYNTWQKETQFLSTGNCDTESWRAFIEYGKNNLFDAVNFALEYLKDDSSNWVILTFVDEVIGDPTKHTLTLGKYINPNTDEIRNLYIAYLDSKKKSWDYGIAYTKQVLNSLDIKQIATSQSDIKTIEDLMSFLEDEYADLSHNELMQGFLFNYMEEDDFIDYLEERYGKTFRAEKIITVTTRINFLGK